MSRGFRPWDVDQVWLLPPSVSEFVAEDHVAHFVRELVRTELDVSAIHESYGVSRGQPPYHPTMMVALLLYAYTQGIYSSRRISRACEQRLDFMAVTGMQKPDFRTVSDFRKRHLSELEELFLQVLLLCRQAGLVSLGHVALDGSKVHANASRRKSIQYKNYEKVEQKLKAKVRAAMANAERADGAEDEEHGDQREDHLPAWVGKAQLRIEKLRAAKKELEDRAATEEAKREASTSETRLKKDGTPRKKSGPKTAKGATRTRNKMQYNFTDPESRIMRTPLGFEQSYNAQIVVDRDNQIIVSRGLSDSSDDQASLPPMLEQLLSNVGEPDEFSADAGYNAEANLALLAQRGIKAFVPVASPHHGTSVPRTPHRGEMAERMLKPNAKDRYRLRSSTVEPVFGQIKHARGFRQFLLRGAVKVRAEWTLICTAHNILKLARA